MKDLNKILNDLNERMSLLVKQRKGENFEEYLNLSDQVLHAERELCAFKKIEYAIPYDFGISNFFNIYNINGNYNSIIVSIENDIKVNFLAVEESKFGGINDEVIDSHELSKKGMGICGSYIVCNSNWIEKLREQNRIHNNFDEESWKKLKHYIIRTKDGEFSCIASDWKIID